MKYDFRVLTFRAQDHSDEYMEAELNKLGEEGYDVVQITTASGGQRAWLRRPRTNVSR